MADTKKKFEFILSVKEKGFTSFQKGEKGLNAFNKELKKGDGLLSSYGGRLIAAAGAFAGFAGLTQMVRDVAGANKELGNLSRTAGTSVSEFQGLAYAASQVGIEQDALADISKDVKDKLGDFIATGGGEFADFFENIAPKVGLTAEALQGLSGPDVLIAVKKAMDDVNLSAEEQIFYLESIGNDASLLTPLLEDNGRAFKEQAEAAQRMGLVMSDMDSAQLQELVKTLNVMDQAMGQLKTDIVVALAPAFKDLSQGIIDNKEEIAELVVGLAEAAGAVLEFALEHQSLIKWLAGSAAGMVVLAKAITTTRTVWSALNAASLAMTGSQIIPYLATLRTSLLATASAAQLLGAALVIGWSSQQVMELVGQMKEAYNASQHLKESQEGLAATEAKAAEKLALVKEQTGLAYDSVLDLAHAVHNGELHFDKATGTWVKGAKEMSEAAGSVADATEESFTAQAKYSKEKLIAMAKDYKAYADKAKGYADDIADRERSLSEEIREIARSGMSDLGAWKDRKKEAEEYAAAARDAVAAGDYDKAVEMADAAKAAYADLNKEVEDGGKVVVSQQQAIETATKGMSDAAAIAKEALEAQQQEAQETADTMDAETGGALSELADKADEFNGSWEDAWAAMEKDASSAIAAVASDLDALEKDRHVNVYVNEVEQNNAGGLAGRGVYHFASGGTPAHFPRLTSPVVRGGAGRIDDVRAMLTRDEFVQSVPAVKYFGVDAMHVINKMLVNRDVLRQALGLRHYNQGGLAVPAHMRQAPVHLATGGLAGAAGSSGQVNNFNVSLNMSGSVSADTQANVKKIAAALIPELKRQWARAS